MGYAKRIDGNQNIVVKGLRDLGYTVFITSMVGHGFVDLVVGAEGLNFMFEVKDPAQPPSKRRLTPDEQIFHDLWAGQIHVVETVEDCVKIILASTQK